MILTHPQQRALVILIVVFLTVIAGQWARWWWERPAPYDFSNFEERFSTRWDSLQADTTAGANRGKASEALSGMPAPARPARPRRTEPTAGDCIDINNASPELLMTLPRIGPKTAARIIAYRNEHGPFRRPEDVMNVKGIGKLTFARFRHLICVKK